MNSSTPAAPNISLTATMGDGMVSAERSLDRITPLIVLGGALVTFGILWDISWHATIGRDSFWTAAHMMIYLGGTLSGCLAGWLALNATFLNPGGYRDLSVGILGARAPMGAWVVIWGSMAMLTSAPLDDWWHNAYGLDVKILSPPHALLAAGMYGVVTGSYLLASARRNRRSHRPEAGSAALLALTANGIQLALASILLTELSFPNLQRTSTFAMASAAMYPGFLVAAARYGAGRWAATRVSLIYMGVICAMVWILPLFPGEPKLAPIFNPRTTMAPPSFPHLLFIPALAIDLLFQASRQRTGKLWHLARVSGSAALFLGLFLFTQWHFSAFLISPSADNALFAGHGRFFSYMGDLSWGGQFWRLRDRPLTSEAVAWALLIATASASVGYAAGASLSRIRR